MLIFKFLLTPTYLYDNNSLFIDILDCKSKALILTSQSKIDISAFNLIEIVYRVAIPENILWVLHE